MSAEAADDDVIKHFVIIANIVAVSYLIIEFGVATTIINISTAITNELYRFIVYTVQYGGTDAPGYEAWLLTVAIMTCMVIAAWRTER